MPSRTPSDVMVPRPPRISAWVLVGAAVLLGWMALIEFVRGLNDTARLQAQLHDIVGDLPREDVAARLDALAEWTVTKHHLETTDYAELGGAYEILKAPPAVIAAEGGHCGNLSRLFVTMARLDGLRARRVHLYDVTAGDEPYTHAVVEVWVDGGWVVVDPLYGVVFRDDDGELATAEQLAADHDLVRRQIRTTAEDITFEHWPPGPYDFERYRYDETRRIRWEILPAGEWLRDTVADAIGEAAADEMAYPDLFERPHYFLAVLYGVIACLMLGAGLFLGLRREPMRVSAHDLS
jgi:hypothetical protein